MKFSGHTPRNRLMRNVLPTIEKSPPASFSPNDPVDETEALYDEQHIVCGAFQQKMIISIRTQFPDSPASEHSSQELFLVFSFLVFRNSEQSSDWYNHLSRVLHSNLCLAILVSSMTQHMTKLITNTQCFREESTKWFGLKVCERWEGLTCAVVLFESKPIRAVVVYSREHDETGTMRNWHCKIKRIFFEIDFAYQARLSYPKALQTW